MSDTARLCLLLQAHTQLLSIRVLAAEGTKEYKADWLKNADTVVRDGTGKFAKKGTSIAQSVRDATTILKQGFDLTTDTIQSLLKDPEFRKRAGLAAGLPMAKLISNLATQARLNPKLTEKLDEWIANATKEFADQYGDDKSPIAQAIRNSKLTQPPKDASFNDKMEFRVAQFAAYKEALESPEDYSKRDEIIGKAAVAAIPIGVSLAIALGFEVAIPLFMAQGVNWATVLSSVAIGEAADFAVQKGMDKLEINNPALRIGASMVAGILAGGLVTGVNKINNKGIQKVVQGIEKAPFQSRIADKKVSIEKVLDEMGLKFSEISEIIDNYNNSKKTQSILIKEIKESKKKQEELMDSLYTTKNPELFRELTIEKNSVLDKEAQLRIAKGNGYSPEKRLLEAADILEKEGPDSPRYLWRKAVLQAEQKYGKYLNKIQDEVDNAYDELITALNKDHGYKAEPTLISRQDFEKIGSLPESVLSSPVLELSENIKNTITNAVDGFQNIVNIPLKIHIASVTDNVYTLPGKKATPKIASVHESLLKDYYFWKEEINGYIDIGGVLSMDNTNILFTGGYNKASDQATHIKEALWHEIGHLTEMSIRNVSEISQSLLEDREAESLLAGDLIKMGYNFADTPGSKIVVSEDHFFSSYMGIQHIKNDITVATELVSSGFEGLSSPWMAKSMTIRDRESLLYAIAVSEMS